MLGSQCILVFSEHWGVLHCMFLCDERIIIRHSLSGLNIDFIFFLFAFGHFLYLGLYKSNSIGWRVWGDGMGKWKY